tara:strand:+ start:344 stop:670 length:327 start_codon:yes stop_codon:yes gene_type:complete
MAILKNLEEKNMCSGGFCNSDGGAMLTTYIFSNINDGLPKGNCHDAFSKLIMGSLDQYRLGFIVTLCEAILVTATYSLVILFKIYKKCCSKKEKQKKKDKEARKKRRE